ncbi:alpha/beta-hydrolase [Aulographum hederae CBS 113979]|uniref:Carboxylic ester hydrolase n=1 Tax=Aulographum hederae CBS 113979 TaxID=1176131 RepID=A0A6G1GZI1_9PEZI|nr:alpha/beta-hydrolase [Aulographum hederae CBS 113979]
MLFNKLFAALFLANSAFAEGTAWNVGQAIKTTSGTVTGKPSKFHSDVSEYLGIRFGQSTAGANRFLPPKRYTSNGSVNATQFGAACPQSVAPGILGVIGTSAIAGPTSEDCLFINVWTKPQSGEKKKAVMLWIYGGAFVLGTSGFAVSDGANITANHDIVVVSFNYRVNLFGFPGAPGLVDQNPGLLDQRMAVEWTRDNIAAFGGDPERITLFGESAGSSSVDAYAYAWKDDPIVNAFIAQSGSALTTNLFKPAAKTTDQWYDAARKLGCTGTGPPTVECMRSKDVYTVQQAMPQGAGPGAANAINPPFRPTVDGKTVFGDIFARAKGGQFAKRPMLIGSNYNESTLFVNMLGLNKSAAVQLDEQFRCTAADSAKARLMAKVPIWRYLFANNAPGSTSGATHGDDVPFVFGDGQTGMSRVFQPLWAAFAKDPLNGLKESGWPGYNPAGKTLGRIGYHRAVSVDYVQPKVYDGVCPPSKV